MKRNLIPRIGATLLGTGLALTGLQAQTVTLLESFEDSVDSVVATGGARTDEEFEISQHTKEGADDTRVTDGEKALKLTLIGNYGWGNDATFTFSEEASNLIKQAWLTKAEARYLIRYDVEFPTEGVNWGNFMGHLGGWDYAQLEAGGGTNRRMTIPLDLVTNDLAAEDLVTMTIIDQYGIVDGTESISVYIDNIRLIDTYVPGAVPEITLLNGFETQEDVDKLIEVSDRYEAKLHTKTGAADVAVTEGEGSLEYTINAAGGWIRDFTIPFKGTVMETIARIAQEDRTRYTLRMDAIFEAQADGDWPATWQNFIVREAGGGALNFAMHRNGGDQHVVTFSAPLDDMALMPGDPENPDDENPGISLVNQGGWGPAGMTMHIDNIRLIDTGKAPLGIQDLAVNPEGGVDVRWGSSGAQTYGLQTSNNLTDWTELVTGLIGDGAGTETTYTDAAATLSGQSFYRVFVAGQAPPLNEGFENGLGDWTNIVADGNTTGTTVWEVGEPTNGPGAAKTGAGAAGTDLGANATVGTWVLFESPVAALGTLLFPHLTFSYFLESGPNSAARVNIFGSDGSELYAPSTPDEAMFFTENTDGWQDVRFDLSGVAGGQKIIVQFEFIGNDDGAGFFIDDVLIEDVSANE